MFISIILPVYNDSNQLIACLEALENQTYAKELYEVIVVDNNSEEDIAAVVTQFSQAHLAYEGYRGSYAARNKGLSVAKGELIGFTDSDCIPARDWIEKGVMKLLQYPECGFIAGKIELFFKNSGKPNIVELYDRMNFLRQEYYVNNLNFGATANLFTRTEVFEKVGLFNADLKSSGDREWGQRLFKYGYSQVYADEVSVTHPARYKLNLLQKKVARITEGLYSKENKELKPILSFLKEAYLDIKPPRKEILALLRDQRLGTKSIKNRYILLFIFLRWVAAWTKVTIYISRKISNKKLSVNRDYKLVSHDR